MGAPVSGMQAGEQAAAEALLSSFKTMGAAERRRHEAVHNYWLAIRGDRDFPTIRDLDPLQISDAGPCSVLLELIGGGEDAEIRHIGDTLKADVEVARIVDAPRRSLLSCIASKLAIVAISRDALAFEDEFETAAGTARCRVTLLPFSSTGPWVDYVYGFITSESVPGDIEEAPEMIPNPVEVAPETPVDEVEVMATSPDDVEPAAECVADPVEPAPEAPATESPSLPSERPGFSPKTFDPLAGVEGFFGTVVNVEQPATLVASADPEESQRESENPVQNRLAEVRAKADEARIAKLQSNAALYEGVSAAYDFALDAEDKAEEYLKLVETQGLKIQLRSPMAPVVKLAFDGLCDESTIAQLEGVLAWALQMNLPRGSLAARIETEGGIEPILNG